jgi:16S rRNA processing protein RimM
MSDLIVARVRRPHGVAGEILVSVETDRPRHVFKKGRVLHLGDQNGESVGRTFALDRMRPVPDGAILRLEGVTNRDEADALRAHVLLIPATEAAPPEPDEVRYRDLIGLVATDADGVELGRVVDLLAISPGELLVVRGSEGKEILVPFVKEIVQEVDLDRRVVLVKLPEGLREL